MANVSATMAADLTAKGQLLLSSPLASNWALDTYQSRFEADDETQRSFATDGVLIYLNCEPSKDDIGEPLCILYYMAVSPPSRIASFVVISCWDSGQL